MKKGIIIFILVVAFLSLFLTWFKLPWIDTSKGIDLDFSFVPIVILIINILFVVTGKWATAITGFQNKIVIFSGLIALLWTIYAYFNYKTNVLAMGDGNFISQIVSDQVEIQQGFVVFIAACTCWLLLGLLWRK